MAPTRIADVVVPEVFNPYVIERTSELSAFEASGVIAGNPELDRLAVAGGKLINMPFWEDLSGDDEVLSDSGALTPQNIQASQDIAALLMRGKAWAANDLSVALSGDDPMGAIADLVAGYWARRRQATLISTLAGVFNSATMAENTHDIGSESGAAGTYTGTTFIDASFKLGDHEDMLTAVAMHSQTLASLRKQDLIQFSLDSQNMPIPFYQGKRVVVDDGMPVEQRTVDTVVENVFTTYIFGAGAIGLGNGGAPYPTETDRDKLAGDDILINRQHFILHPRGVAFQSASVTGSSPTNGELALQSNWNRVYEPKHVRIVAFKHRLA